MSPPRRGACHSEPAAFWRAKNLCGAFCARQHPANCRDSSPAKKRQAQNDKRSSFAHAKRREDDIQHIVDVGCPGDFIERAKGLIQIE
jgi:hypothetical protein